MAGKNKLRIAISSSNILPVPPPKGPLGAVERVIYCITEGLVQRGHDVTLFATGDSQTSARLESVVGCSPSLNRDKIFGSRVDYDHLLMSKIYEKAGDFDIIHSNLAISAFYAHLVKTPTVVTLHWPLNVEESFFLKESENSQYYISISDAQRRFMPNLNYIKTICHGVDTNKIRFKNEKGEYLLFAGRMTFSKGADLAVEIAKKSGEKLLLVGETHKGRKYTLYWNKKIKPFIDGKQIQHIGTVAHEDIFDYMANAKALLVPIRWPEPFGLVMIEAMATGTPVIGFAEGSVPEIIKDGETGFVVNTLEEMVSKVNNLGEIDRKKCRERVEKHFSLERMIDKYESAYRAVLGL